MFYGWVLTSFVAVCVLAGMSFRYGDVVPTSTLGRFVGVVAMVSGVLTMALPISVVTTEFAREYDVLMIERAAQRRAAARRRAHRRGVMDINTDFNLMVDDDPPSDPAAKRAGREPEEGNNCC